MQSQIPRPSKSKYHPTLKMFALQYQGKDSLKWTEVPRPTITDSTDAIVKVTATSICGSDLHLYHGLIPGTVKGDIVGHECVGTIEEVGPEVQKFKRGDRVIISPVIACGQCDYCKRRESNCCDISNPSQVQGQGQVQEKVYGHNAGALFGHSKSFGGYDGCQAEYVRVPFAQTNLFPIPENMSDKEALLVADTASTGFHANVLADVKPGDRVVVFGCGPVGLLTQMWARYRQASIVVAIDVDPKRLGLAKQKYGSVIINSKEEDPLDAVEKLMPGGPDKVIDCVGFRFPESFFQKLQMKFKTETDAPNIVNLAIKMVRKNGRITLIGDYGGYTNRFNIGGFMEKHLTMNGGQLSPQTYSEEILAVMSSGKVNPSEIFTHTFPMSRLDEAYKKSEKQEEGILKVLILPDSVYNVSK